MCGCVFVAGADNRLGCLYNIEISVFDTFLGRGLGETIDAAVWDVGLMLLMSLDNRTYDGVAEIVAVVVECDCDGGARNAVGVWGWGEVAVCNKSVQSFTFVPAMGLSILKGARHSGNTGTCEIDA